MKDEGARFLKDRRTKGFSIVHNVVIDGWAAKMGIHCFGVYAALIRYANKDGHCWPKQGTIAELLGISKTKVWESIRFLKQWRFIEVEPGERPGGGNTYATYILIDPPEPPTTWPCVPPPERESHCDTRENETVIRVESAGDMAPTRNTSRKNNTHEVTRPNEQELCSLDLCSLKEGNVMSARALFDTLAAADISDTQLIGNMAALYATDRLAAKKPLRKGRLATWRWFMNNPASITQDDEDRATAMIRELRGETRTDPLADGVETLGDILEGATWLGTRGAAKRTETTARTTG